MNIVNNGQAKSLVKRLPFLFGFIFALCLICFNTQNVKAISYVLPDNPYNNFYIFHDRGNEAYYAIATDEKFYIDGNFPSTHGPLSRYKLVDGGTTWVHMQDFSAIPFQMYDSTNLTTGTPTYEFTYCNTDVYTDISYTTVFWSEDTTISATTIKFIQPNSSPFLDTTDGFNFLISYTVPAGTSHNDFSLTVSCPDFDPTKWEITGQEYNVTTGQGFLKCFISPVAIGTHTITAKIGTKTTQTVIERLGGSVDANGDGVDDRTNLPVGDGHVKVDDPTGSGAIGALENMKDFMGSMSDFSGKIFGFLPNEVRYTMIFVISVMGFIAIKKFLL